MGETAEILALWRRAALRGDQVALATVVRVQGSSYRKPGARMLVTSGGERAGTISGGCLEAEVSRKIWWLTAKGPAVQQYQSFFEEDSGDIPWGLGCGGTVWIHLEQEPTSVLRALAASLEQGTPSVIFFGLEQPCTPAQPMSREYISTMIEPISSMIAQVFDSRRSIHVQSDSSAFFTEYLAPPPRLTIFGAGDDAKPILEFAQTLGWRAAIADSRAHFLQPGRFPPGTELRLLACDASIAGPASASSPLAATLETGVAPGELAVVLTHSYEQDRAIVAALLPCDLVYLGVLGPRHRTRRLLEEIAPALGLSVEEGFARLHSPVGLDLGASDPASVALSIVAGLQAALTGRSLTATRQATPQRMPGLAAPHA